MTVYKVQAQIYPVRSIAKILISKLVTPQILKTIHSKILPAPYPALLIKKKVKTKRIVKFIIPKSSY